MLLFFLLIHNLLREEALRKEAFLRPNLRLVAGRNTAKKNPWLLFCGLISDWMRDETLQIENPGGYSVSLTRIGCGKKHCNGKFLVAILRFA
jgi:hypothetical protein